MRSSAPRFLRSLCVLLALSASAQAADRRVAIIVTPAREPLTSLATLAQRGLTLAARSQENLNVLDLSAEAAPEETARSRAAAQEAERSLVRARELYDSNALLDAAKSANAAITRFEESDLEHTMDGLLKALALSAAISQRQGNLEAARATLVRLFTARPSVDIDAALLNPPMRTLTQEVRAAVAGKPRATLSVRTTPAGAAAFVDGAFAGVTPIELTSLTSGDHYLTVKHPGYSSAQERFVLDDKLKLALPLQPALKGEPLVRQRAALENAPSTASLRSAAAAELGKWTHLDEVWIGRVEGRPGRYALRVYRLSGTGESLGVAETGFHEARIHAPETYQPIVTALGRPPAVASAGSSASSDLARTDLVAKKPRWQPSQRTWSYVALGGSAALAGTGLVLGLGAKSKADQAREIAKTDPAAYPAAHERATKQARIADVLFIAAGAGAATSAILYFTSDAPSASAQPEGLSWSVAPTLGGAAASVGGTF